MSHTSDIRKTKKAVEIVIITDKETILNFLSGKTKDYKGRTIHDMIDLSDKQLELCHDQIQWMFPLHEKSNFAFTYPVITPEVVINLRKKYPQVLKNLRASTIRMMAFYGISAGYDLKKIKRWAQPYNHNMLRITRIIRSLRLFGLEKEADLFHFLCCIAIEYTDQKFDFTETKRYWDKALKEDIWATLKEPRLPDNISYPRHQY